MKLEDIESADCNVIQTNYYEKSMEVVFEEIFDIKNNIFHPNGKLLIEHWSFTEGKKIESNGPGMIPHEKALKYPYEFNFSLIQEITQEENKLTLKGYCLEYGFWLEYSFTDAKYTFSY